ncbi:hypothetical protein JHN63_17435 [Streptomyces sp. MBT65]|uniref:DUF6542 domain-containing protein n=1 Tax=Streptomyces sp. MBT65 TaxID=1488395 RepID=UPI00190964EC|nr:DUF6542 domain-containing protein [Streptomyces sp. MBT65]MBK3575565.1 hypothetical protein [Streptomyces sp. MBT65]
MEQHRTRPPQPGARRGAPPLPPQAGRGPNGGAARTTRPNPQARGTAQRRPAAARRPGPEAAQAVRQLPNPRLTGLGGGLFCAAVMFLLGCADQLLFGASLTVYGVLFLPVCVLTALWIRRGDLLTAPVVVPIAFAVGLFPVAEGSGGLGNRLVGLFTGLATQAGWLYGGTLVAGLIATVRRIRLLRRRRRG